MIENGQAVSPMKGGGLVLIPATGESTWRYLTDATVSDWVAVNVSPHTVTLAANLTSSSVSLVEMPRTESVCAFIVSMDT